MSCKALTFVCVLTWSPEERSHLPIVRPIVVLACSPLPKDTFVTKLKIYIINVPFGTLYPRCTLVINLFQESFSARKNHCYWKKQPNANSIVTSRWPEDVETYVGTPYKKNTVSKNPHKNTIIEKVSYENLQKMGSRGLGWVESGQVGAGRVGSGRVWCGRVGSGRVG